jgi:hypothetical protein
MVEVTDCVTVPVRVVVAGAGQPRTDEQNLDMEAVRAKEPLMELAQLRTLATLVHEGSAAEARLAKAARERASVAARVGSDCSILGVCVWSSSLLVAVQGAEMPASRTKPGDCSTLRLPPPMLRRVRLSRYHRRGGVGPESRPSNT